MLRSWVRSYHDKPRFDAKQLGYVILPWPISPPQMTNGGRAAGPVREGLVHWGAQVAKIRLGTACDPQ